MQASSPAKPLIWRQLTHEGIASPLLFTCLLPHGIRKQEGHLTQRCSSSPSSVYHSVVQSVLSFMHSVFVHKERTSWRGGGALCVSVCMCLFLPLTVKPTDNGVGLRGCLIQSSGQHHSTQRTNTGLRRNSHVLRVQEHQALEPLLYVSILLLHLLQRKTLHHGGNGFRLGKSLLSLLSQMNAASLDPHDLGCWLAFGASVSLLTDIHSNLTLDPSLMFVCLDPASPCLVP